MVKMTGLVVSMLGVCGCSRMPSTYTLVNEVPLETYLRGVVTHEIGASAPYAAVEAQAITRTCSAELTPVWGG